VVKYPTGEAALRGWGCETPAFAQPEPRLAKPKPRKTKTPQNKNGDTPDAAVLRGDEISSFKGSS
jgi:hypothetical protein